jgi:catechol 2,3-dioxygenase-like lactoylglutathione lyase family enzyme
MIESIAFIAYAVKDIAASRRFYEDILGLKLAWSSHDEWFEYDLGDTTFAITSTHIEHSPPVRGALVGFEVSDLDGEVSRLRRLGVPFKREEIRETAVCRYAIVFDPDGTEVLIHRRKSAL